MKTSRIAAKAAVRILLFLILLALVPVLTGSDPDRQWQHVYISTANKWVFAFPVLLIAGFIILLVLCTIRKYATAHLNWLLVLNMLMLIGYGISIYVRLWQV